MTTYIPNLTLPSFVFNNPAASVLLPIALGTAVGYSTRRMISPPPPCFLIPLTFKPPNRSHSPRLPTSVHVMEAAAFPPAPLGLWPRLDRSLRHDGLLGLPRRTPRHLASQHARTAPSFPLSLPTEPHVTNIQAKSTISAAKHGATLYTIQLALNMIWMPLFFGMRRPVEATVDIVALLGVNGYLAWLWGTQVDKMSGWLLVPYLGWLSFATYLSAGTGYLNNWDLRTAEEKARGEKKGL